MKIKMPDYVYLPATCVQTVTYKLKNTSYGADPTVLHSFIHFDPTTKTVSLSNGKYNESNEWYQFTLVATAGDLKNKDFIFTINTGFKNRAPTFSIAPPPQIVKVGVDQNWKLFGLSDPDGDPISQINIKMGDLKWLNFVPSTLTFSVAGKQIPADQKPARIAIVVSDP